MKYLSFSAVHRGPVHEYGTAKQVFPYGRRLLRCFREAEAIFWRLLLALPGTDAEARRVALILGNSAYQHTSRLANPANDASAMAALFKSAGFDVVQTRLDVGNSELRRVIRNFADQVRDADVAVAFYAGHAIEVDGQNYLILTDALLRRDVDVEGIFSGLTKDRIVCP